MARRLIVWVQRDERGSMAVEFGLIAVLLFTIIGGTIEFGRYFWYRNALQQVASDAARCAAISTSDINFYTATDGPYGAANTALTSPCLTYTAATGWGFNASYVTTLAAGRGVSITTSGVACSEPVPSGSSDAATCSSQPTSATPCSVAYASSNNETNYSFYKITLMLTYPAIFSFATGPLGTISTDVCVPYSLTP